jgi:hypothetical protein
MKNATIKIAKALALIIVCSSLSSCDDPQIYGSVGVSSYGGGGYHGGSRYGTSVRVGGRIY